MTTHIFVFQFYMSAVVVVCAVPVPALMLPWQHGADQQSTTWRTSLRMKMLRMATPGQRMKMMVGIVLSWLIHMGVHEPSNFTCLLLVSTENCFARRRTFVFCLLCLSLWIYICSNWFSDQKTPTVFLIKKIMISKIDLFLNGLSNCKWPGLLHCGAEKKKNSLVA